MGRRAGFWLCLLSILAGATLRSAESASALRLAVVEPAENGKGRATLLAEALANRFGLVCHVARFGVEPSGAARTGLRDSDAAVFIHGPGAKLNETDLAELRAFLDAGRGLVVLGFRDDAWPAAIDARALLGAKPAGLFAGGASLAVINLFPHAVLTGVTRLETSQPATRYDQLADDALLLIEGTVGETTTPLAWLRRRATGRLCHVAFAEPSLCADADFQTFIGNAVLWTAARPIPNAKPAVQRTFMSDAYPGAFAITLPNGPSLCFDPVRGGVNYVWDGDFVDLRPRWLTKQGEPARVFGDVFYREKEWQPLRAGARNEKPDFEFRGYTLNRGEPEFHYEVGGRTVHESFATAPSGGLLRRFRVEPGSAPLWLQLEGQPDAEVSIRGAERDGNVAYFDAPGGGEFTIEIRRKTLTSR